MNRAQISAYIREKLGEYEQLSEDELSASHIALHIVVDRRKKKKEAAIKYAQLGELKERDDEGGTGKAVRHHLGDRYPVRGQGDVQAEPSEERHPQ